MSGHLCLKWNNHSSAFLKSISSIQVKEKYCDATIVCQGKYFPVHRVILSTCSNYFDEIFERIQCPHPYIIFKDIEPQEMELLLNYMYQGEVNVVQELLPALIKAAEALSIKGLAVPDELPTNKEGSSKKKANSSLHDSSQSKRKAEDSTGSKRRREDSVCEAREVHISRDKSGSTSENICTTSESQVNEIIEPSFIKQELTEPCTYVDNAMPQPDEDPQKSVFNEYPNVGGEAVFVKSEEGTSNIDEFEGQPPWNNFEGDLDSLQAHQVGELAAQEDVSDPTGLVPPRKILGVSLENLALPSFSQKALAYLHGQTLEGIFLKEARDAVINEIIQFLDSNNLLCTNDNIYQRTGYLKLQFMLMEEYPNCLKEKCYRKNNRKSPLGSLFAKLADRRRKRHSRATMAACQEVSSIENTSEWQD